MDITNQGVVHKVFGDGVVIEHAGGFVSVDFGGDVKKFQFPGGFQTFLTAKDSIIADQINELLMKAEEEKTEKIKAEEEAKSRQEELQRARKEEAKKAETKKRGTGVKRVSSTKSSLPKLHQRANVAFKCTYCDGGKSESQIGFEGVCSDKVINNNVAVEKKSWCSASDCFCMMFHNNKIDRKELDDKFSENNLVCYESRMFIDWKAYAGMHIHGDNNGKSKTIKNVKSGSLCVLTTRDPRHSEDLRYIFAVFLIDEVFEGDERGDGYVRANPEFKLKLSPVEARAMRFWKYYKSEAGWDSLKWGSGLYRHITDEHAIQMLKDIADLKKNTGDEEIAQHFYEQFSKICKQSTVVSRTI